MLFNFHVVLVLQFLCRVIGPAIAGKFPQIITKFLCLHVVLGF